MYRTKTLSAPVSRATLALGAILGLLLSLTFLARPTVVHAHDLTMSLSKVDQNGDAIAGVQFTLTRVADPSITATLSTGADGTLTFVSLSAGNFTLTEEAPEGCTGIDEIGLNLAADGTVTFNGAHEGASIDADGNLVIENSCEHAGGQLAINLTKVDQNGDAIAGVELTLTGVSDPSFSATLSTGADGTLTFDGLDAGDYTLSETAPDGCTGVAEIGLNLAADGTITFTGAHDGASIDANGNLVIENTCEQGGQQPSSISLTKVDQNGDAIEGVEFTLTGVTDASFEVSGKTAADGSLTFSGLAAGDYTLTETAPEGCTGIAAVGLTLAANGAISFAGAHVGVTVDADGNLAIENTCEEGGQQPGGNQPPPGGGVKGTTGGPGGAGIPNTAFGTANDSTPGTALGLALLLLAGLGAIAYANVKAVRRRS